MIFNRDISVKMPGLPGVGIFVLAAFALSACDTGPDLSAYNLAPSPESVQQGYPPLLPLSYFAMSAITPLGSDNLAARAAALRQRMQTMNGSVLTAAEIEMLQAAIARHNPL